MLYVDSRWTGRSGIARFSTEVLSRLQSPYRHVALSGDPFSRVDPFRLGRLSLSSKDALYSPGFNAGITRATQLITVHDLIHLDDSSESSAAKRAYYEVFVRSAIKKAKVVMTVSEVSRTRIEEWLADEEVKVVNVGNGCSTAFNGRSFESGQPAADFLYVGTAKPHKNLRVVLDALKYTRQLRLRIVASDYEDVRSLVKSSGVEKQVTLLTGLTDDELVSEYRNCLALVFPSTLEGFGLPALEALRSGKRVIYYDGCHSVREIVGSGGLAVSAAKDASEWASALESLASMDQPYLSEQEVMRLTGEYSWDRVVEKVSEVLHGRMGR